MTLMTAPRPAQSPTDRTITRRSWALGLVVPLLSAGASALAGWYTLGITVGEQGVRISSLEVQQAAGSAALRNEIEQVRRAAQRREDRIMMMLAAMQRNQERIMFQMMRPSGGDRRGGDN